MKRFAIIVATMIGVVCFSACDWEPLDWSYPIDNSKITMNITCPSLGLDNVTFCNTERDWWHTKQYLRFYDDTSFDFRLRKDLISTDAKYKAHILIDLYHRFPSLEFGYKYNISDLDDIEYSNDWIYIYIEPTDSADNMYYEDNSCLDGHVIFTSSVKNNRCYVMSGNFRFVFEDAIISNGTFTNLECF